MNIADRSCGDAVLRFRGWSWRIDSSSSTISSGLGPDILEHGNPASNDIGDERRVLEDVVSEENSSDWRGSLCDSSKDCLRSRRGNSCCDDARAFGHPGNLVDALTSFRAANFHPNCTESAFWMRG